MILIILVLFILSFLVCFYDWNFRRIPNVIIILIFLLAVIKLLVSGDFSNFFWLAILVPILFLVWKVGIWGAGDSKLLLAFFPMINAQYYVATLCFIGLLGFITTLVFLVYKTVNKKIKFNTVPYGIPIALSCFLTSIASF
ncbi:prepilin peptidase [Vibrio rhodolitus]|uniref:prepilin peptidase n=1 Tax=Vibrio rhodolitus TaxID=2231649 RepID=UPI000E0B0A3A